MKPIIKVADGGMWILLHEDGSPVHVGEKVVTRTHGDTYFVEGGAVPHKSGSTGRIWVSPVGGGMGREFFPSVFDCKWEFRLAGDKPKGWDNPKSEWFEVYNS